MSPARKPFAAFGRSSGRSSSRSLRRAALVAILLLAAATPVLAAEESGVIGFDLARVINFSILATILVLVLRKPLGGYLNARTQQIRDQLVAARENREQAGEAAEQAARVAAGLDDETAAARRRILEAASAEARRIVAAAEEQAARITAGAEQELDAEVRSAERRLASRAAEAVARLARARLREGVSAEDHRRLVGAGLRAIRSPNRAR